MTTNHYQDTLTKMENYILWTAQCSAAEEKIHKALRFAGVKPVGIVVIGSGGVGKTVLVEKVAEELCKENVELEDRTLMPILSITAPSSGRENALHTLMLNKLGHLNSKSIKPSDRARVIDHLLIELGVKLIIVDEVHDSLPETVRGKVKPAFSYLKQLMDRTKIPIILIGTEKAENIYAMGAEIGTRFRTRIKLLPFGFGNKDAEWLPFAEIASKLATLLPLKKPLSFLCFEKDECNNYQFSTKLNDKKLLIRLYFATQGLHRNLKDFFMNINADLIDNPNLKITLDYLSNVYENMEYMNESISGNPFTMDVETMERQMFKNS